MYTDLDVCRDLSAEIAEYYEAALRYEQTIPVYAMLNYRKITEVLCELMLDSFAPGERQKLLYDNIHRLADLGLIDETQKQALHQLRIVTNRHVHRNALRDSESLTDLQQAKSQLLAVLERCYTVIKGQPVAAYTFTQPDMQDADAILLRALSSYDSSDQYRAGWVYVNRGEEAIAHTTSVFEYATEQELVEHNHCLRMAVAHFESAFLLSADAYLERLLTEEGAELDLTAALYQHKLQTCNLDMLYTYCDMALALGEDSNRLKRAEQLLTIAVERGHTPSAGLLGNLYLDRGEQEKALPLLQSAAEAQIDSALVGLYQYYALGQFCAPDPVKMRDYLQQCEQVGSPRCISALASAYFNGLGRELNQEKGIELAELAVERGERRMLEPLRFMKQEYLVNNMFRPNLPEVPDKIGRNAPCYCGSGKKYKRCCGSR